MIKGKLLPFFFLFSSLIMGNSQILLMDQDQNNNTIRSLNYSNLEEALSFISTPGRSLLLIVSESLIPYQMFSRKNISQSTKIIGESNQQSKMHF